jgi:hypothetical protein
MKVYRRKGGVTPLIVNTVFKMVVISFMLNRKECHLLVEGHHMKRGKWRYGAEITSAEQI